MEKSEDTPKRQDRSLDLIATFKSDYAEGWHFAVGKWFKDELDIKYMIRAEGGKKVMRWTQGPYYNFKEGHIIYDNPKGYSLWKEALRYINLICQIDRSTPNKLDEKGKFINGQVVFTLSKPNKSRDNIKNIGQYNLTQNQFVGFLKTGNMNTD